MRWKQKLIDFFAKSDLPAGTKVLLFGSRARGDAEHASDIDLGFIDCLNYRVQRFTEAVDALNIPYEIDLVDLDKVSAEFKTKALAEGVILFAK